MHFFFFPQTSGSHCPPCRGIFFSLRTKAETVILGTFYDPHSQRPKPPSLTKHHNGFLRWGSSNIPPLKKKKNGELEQIAGRSQMERRCLRQIVLIENPLPCFLRGLLGSEKSGLDHSTQWVLPVSRCLAWRSSRQQLNGADTRP